MNIIIENYKNLVNSHWTDMEDFIPVMESEIKKRSNCTVVEFGVRCGVSTVNLLSVIEETGGHLYSVDIISPIDDNHHAQLWPASPPCRDQFPREFFDLDIWTFILGNSTSEEVFEKISHGIDILLIDSSHLYKGTLVELNMYTPKVKQGGIVLLHDIAHEVYGAGLMKAINEYCEEHNLKYVMHPGNNGMAQINVE